MNIQYIHPADQLVMFMQRIYDKGLTTMSGGNLSIRDTEGNIWITPAGIDKGTLTRRDIICVRPDGTCEGPHKPSSELPFHQSVYRQRPELPAHSHPPGPGEQSPEPEHRTAEHCWRSPSWLRHP